jgi:hypothetical protein
MSIRTLSPLAALVGPAPKWAFRGIRGCKLLLFFLLAGIDRDDVVVFMFLALRIEAPGRAS